MARPTKYCREDMLAKATDLFWDRGYRGVSIKDLVSETGVLAGSIYGCFGSKDGIFTECVHHYAQQSAESYRAAEAAGSPLQQIEALFDNMTAESELESNRRGCFVTNALLEIAPDRPEISKVLNHYIGRSENWIAERLRAAQDAGEILPDVDVENLAACVFGVMYGIKVKVRANESAERIQSFKRTMLASLLDPARRHQGDTPG